jgi:hypothetical protein
MNVGRMNMLRKSGSSVDMMDSASRFVCKYPDGIIGAPVWADIKTKVGTFSCEERFASCTAAEWRCLARGLCCYS